MTITLSDEGLEAAISVATVNEFAQQQAGFIAAERALTIYLDKREIVTVMTLGTHPELLALGWLRNQRLVENIEHVDSIIANWETDSVNVTTNQEMPDLDVKLGRKTVTTGCGQGAMYGDLMTDINKIKLHAPTLDQSYIYALLKTLSAHNEIYRQAGAVHGCALCSGTDILSFVEDVGRHNAVDTIAGDMWLNNLTGDGKIFYTTGRLTSEMVIKVAQMGVSVLLSRSGITHMGLLLARKVGVTLIARAKGRHFLVYHGAERINFDAMPKAGPRQK